MEINKTMERYGFKPVNKFAGHFENELDWSAMIGCEYGYVEVRPALIMGVVHFYLVGYISGKSIWASCRNLLHLEMTVETEPLIEELRDCIYTAISREVGEDVGCEEHTEGETIN